MGRHLTRVLKTNGYPGRFINSAITPQPRQRPDGGDSHGNSRHPLHHRCERRDKEDLQGIQHQSSLQIRQDHALPAHYGERSTTTGPTVHGGLPDPVLLWKGVHRQDHPSIGGKIEKAISTVMRGLSSTNVG